MALSEQATRKRLIDKALETAGWKPIVRYDPGVPRDLVAFEEYPTANGPADCALFHDDEPLAIVEAKKLAVGPQNVFKQAQRCTKALFAQADALEEAAAAAYRRLEQVDQAVLARAFRGELVEQDPEDEPAEVLVESI